METRANKFRDRYGFDKIDLQLEAATPTRTVSAVVVKKAFFAPPPNQSQQAKAPSQLPTSSRQVHKTETYVQEPPAGMLRSAGNQGWLDRRRA